ncbi:hypothetical protein [Bythopirellula polymerisocia]|uniref:Uncharacterized protein n=1 Tax=Bythopirellula polymerisocia TaxID=2528003 RepID=A0A5C6CDH5_9BACT|nr:hypothetical protein [Bythopirellula polymerisocia]TWU22630.1 hypothetical protein Pla144_40900 [Bythopirellula polymerisocia]
MKSRKHSSSYRPSFSMERLEERQMMAGDVAAYMNNGNLYVNEASGQAGTANAVQVSQLSNGLVRVQGTANQGGGQTLVNGLPYQDFNIPTYSQQVGHLVVYLGGGNDSIIVGTGNVVNKFNTISINTASSNPNDPGDADLVKLYNVSTRAGSNIYTGGGSDNVVLDKTIFNANYGGYFSVDTGEGNDSVRFFGVTTKDYLNIYTKGGNDYIDVSSSTIGDGIGIDYLNVYAGTGADSINFNTNALGSTYVRGHLNVYAYDNIAENDADTVDMRSTYVSHHINTSLGGGNDQLRMLGVFAGTDIVLFGDAGNDTFNLTDVRAADDFFAYLGEGDDSLKMEYVGADEMILDGEGGNDSVSRWNNAYVRDLALRNWESINGVTQVYRKAVTPIIKGGNFSTLSR